MNAPSQRIKIPTNIRGLDEILNGGIPSGGFTLISGGPGTGKTLFGLEFLIRGAMEGEPGIMITFEEREDALRGYAGAFGLDMASLEKKGLIALIGARLDPDGALSGDFDLGGVLAILRHTANTIHARRIVIDAPDVFLRLLGNRAKERSELYRLISWLRDENLTTVMAIKSELSSGPLSEYEMLEYTADCVIQLDQRVLEQITTRRIRVVKYRGSSFGRNEYPFSITNEGVWIIPITETHLNHVALGGPIPTGVSGLDELMNGGYLLASCSLISGASGTGKTTIAAHFANESTKNGKRVFYINFEESPNSMLACILSSGINLQPALDSGALHFLSTMPESQGIEEHLIQAFRHIENFKPDIVIVDAISACRRMGSQNAAFDYLLRLIDHCKRKGITSLLTNLTEGGSELQEITGLDLSSMIDTVVILRHTEHNNRFHRNLYILKMRGSVHSQLVHEFEITNKGVAILASNMEANHVN